MTTMNAISEYDSSKVGQSSALNNVHVEHQHNGYNIDALDSHTMNSLQSSGNANGTLAGSKPEDERKLFVGGLTWDTTQEDLREYFSNFGNIVDCSIKHDPSTGRSRGFAFLVFDSKDIVEKILSQNEHFVKGRKVDPKPAHRRSNVTNGQINANNHHSISTQSSLYTANSSVNMPYANMGIGANMNPSYNNNNNRKVFIGGLDPNFSDSKLREYFSKFGKIDEIDLPYDKEKNERRPFCFISFQSEQAAQEVLRLQRHTIGNMSVDVKRAKPKTVTNQQQQLHSNMFDPYGQQIAYSNYGVQGSSYGSSGYPTGDAYTHWNAYTYNQQANPAAYPYGNYCSTSISSPETSYAQYADHPTNSQYSYIPSNTVTGNDYYSNYSYGASQSAGGYADPNGFNASGYDYGSYYPSMNTGMNATMADNGNGQQSNESPGNQIDYEHDNHYGKAKTSIVSSPTYHPYSRS